MGLSDGSQMALRWVSQMALRWHSDGALRWHSDGTQMALGWHSVAFRTRLRVVIGRGLVASVPNVPHIMHKLQRHEQRRHLLEDGNHLMQSNARRRHSDDTQTTLRMQQSDGSQTLRGHRTTLAEIAISEGNRMTLAEIAITSAAVPFRFRSAVNRELNSRSSISTLSLPLRASPITRYSSYPHTHPQTEERESERVRERERERERERTSLSPVAIRGIQMQLKAIRDHQRQSEVLTCRERTSLLPGVMSSASRRHCSATSCWPSACAALAFLTKALMEHGSYSIARLASARHCSKSAIRGDQRLLEVIRGCWRPSEATIGHQRQFEAI